MLQRTLVSGVSRESILEALVELGEDPTVSRAEAVRQRIDPLASAGGASSSWLRRVVDGARAQLDAERDGNVAVKSEEGWPSLANAIAVLRLAVSANDGTALGACKEALNQLTAVQSAVIAQQDVLNKSELPPDGDAYNVLFDLVGVNDVGVVLDVPTSGSAVEATVAPAVPRVLVTVRGGVAETICDAGVDVEVFDFDNYEAGPNETNKLPAHFADLAELAGAECERDHFPVRYGVEYEVASYQAGGHPVQIWHPVVLSHHVPATPMSQEAFVFKARNSSSLFEVKRDELEARVRENGHALQIAADGDVVGPSM